MGRTLELNGKTCNVPVDVVNTYNTLRRPVKLKRKLEH